MSQQSPSTGRPSTTSSTTAGTQQSHTYTSGPSAASSPPSIAHVSRTEGHSIYGGAPLTKHLSETTAPAGEHQQQPDPVSLAPSRALGVQSILNPSADSEERNSPRIRLPPPSTMDINPQPLLPAPIESPRSRKRTDPPRSPPREHDYPPSTRFGRRVLTPKSPAVRAASLGARRNPSFHSTIQPLQHLPTPGGRTYTAEPGPYRSSDIPPLPPLAIATASSAQGYASHDTNQPRSAQGTDNPNRAVELVSTPRSEQPINNQSSYAKIEHPSPNYRYGSNLPPQLPPGAPLRVLSASGSGAYSHEHHVHGPHEGYQMGQASYQMTLDTDQGPMVVPVELDLQQASKVADEKRKRNAGASARFRQRRKEKEKEASQTIAGLQADLRDVIEERDFYIAERNHFRDLAARHIPPSQLGVRPRSPQHHPRRVTTTASVHSDNLSGEDESYHDHQEQGSMSRRRRTGEYQPSFASRPPHSPSTLGYGTPYTSGPSPYTTGPPPPLPPPTMQYQTPRSLPPAPPPPPPSTRAHSYDPFRRDPYDRNWSK